MTQELVAVADEVIDSESGVRIPSEAEIKAGAGDLRRDAETMVNDMITNVTSIREKLNGAAGKGADRLRKETNRLLNSLEAARPGVVDMTCFLNRQPSEQDLSFSGRVEALVPEARRRLDKTKYMFPEPRSIIDSVTQLCPPDDAAELRIRIAHYLAKMNMVQDGLAASTASRRLLQAAAACKGMEAGIPVPQESADLMAAAKAALGSFLYEARRRGHR
jgi:hypothetical protein